MVKHKIYITKRRGVEAAGVNDVVKKAVTAALDEERVDVPCEISVTITNDKEIWKINKEFRDVDRPTDVLSFPMQELEAGAFKCDETEIDPDSGRLPLGDIVISMERVYAQAEEFGHSWEREAGYLTVHSVLHLLGYDHMDEGPEKRRMREREERIMEKLGLEI